MVRQPRERVSTRRVVIIAELLRPLVLAPRAGGGPSPPPNCDARAYLFAKEKTCITRTLMEGMVVDEGFGERFGKRR